MECQALELFSVQVIMIKNFMEESINGFRILIKVSTLLYFLDYNAIDS
jgi:hypothetical protein